MQDQDEIVTKRIVQPRNFEINFYDDYKQITRTWYSIIIFIPLLITVFIFNGVWITNDFFEILTSDRHLLLKLFALLFIVIGTCFAYYTIAVLFNRTEIVVNRDTIEIKHHPIPWYGNKHVEVNNIQHLIFEEKNRAIGNYNRNMTFNLLGLTMEGKPIKLMTGFKTRNQALYIKQEIENYLGIENEEDKTTVVV